MFPPPWRRPATLPLVLSAALVAASVTTTSLAEAQTAPSAAKPAPHAMTPADIAAWKTLRGATLATAQGVGPFKTVDDQRDDLGNGHRQQEGEHQAAAEGFGPETLHDFWTLPTNW